MTVPGRVGEGETEVDVGLECVGLGGLDRFVGVVRR